MSKYFTTQNAYYGFKVVMTAADKPIEVCRCHSQTMAEKIGAALAVTGLDGVQALQLVNSSWRAYRSFKPVRAN